VLVIFPNPIPELQHAPLPPKCYEPGSVSPTPYFSNVFTSDSHLNLSRSLRMRQKLKNHTEGPSKENRGEQTKAKKMLIDLK